MRRHIRSVRARILLLVFVPVLSLLGLYLFTTSIAGKDALNLARARALKTATSQPVSNFLRQLDTERVSALIYLAAPSPRNLAKFRAQEAATGHVTSALHAALTSGSTLGNTSPAVRQASTALLRDAADLPRLHSSIAARAVTRPGALAAYDKVIGDSYLLLHQVILTQTSTPIVSQALALEQIARSGELLQQENALLAADMAARRFSPADQHLFTKLVGARTTLYNQTLPGLDPGYRARYAGDISPGSYAALAALENTVIRSQRSPFPPPVAPGHWARAVQGVSLGLERAGTQAATALDQQAAHQARVTDLRLLLSGGIGLLAVVASIIVALLAGRGLVRELSDLRRSAEDLADHRLPRMVDQLATGGNLDVAEEPLDIKVKTTEIAQVRGAFAKVERIAVDAAVGQARLREGIGQVFRNLARRSQSVLHRQLALLDRMERRTDDPQELDDLFRIDHLTTCLRRHAESLTILSGQSPARGWQNPVPFMDVIRASVAELVENATIYSPPNTPVVIQGGIVGQGFAVEIEDRGLGMSDDKLGEANANLADPLPFDPANAGQLGLLVAGQLAKRHNIRITLRRNPYGGTTAIVLIPHSVVVAEGFGELEPAKALESTPPMPGQRTSGEQNGFAAEAGTERGLSPDEEPGGAAAAGGHDSPLPSYVAAPPAAAPPRPEAAPSLAEADSAERASAESRAWTGMESPAWSGPRPAADAPARSAIDPPVLPRRVRQASLVPELPDAPPADPLLPGRFPNSRSPEEVRATLSAIQDGWRRGRSMLRPAPGQPHGSGTEAGPGDSGAAAGDDGDHGTQQQETPTDDGGPHGPG